MQDSKLMSLQKNVRESHEYWKENTKRYHEFINFVFNTAIDDNEIAKLTQLQKPNIEFNILETFVNRLRGEFAKQEPSLSVRASDGVNEAQYTQQLFNQMKVVEGIIRHIFFGGKSDGLKYDIYTSQLVGGFSVAKVYTDYVNSRSFEQNIVVEKAFDCTLCGFDPMARDSHKGDGSYCFEIVPVTEHDFREKFGDDLAKSLSFTRTMDDYNWSYSDNNKKIALLCYYYEKIKKQRKIVKLSNGHVVLKKHYIELQGIWARKNIVARLPVVLDERWTTIETIDRHLVCEKEIIETVHTDYTYLPLVFFDGNSQIIKKNDKSPSKQMTRPYLYNAKGIQKMKNFAGQTLGAEIEGMIQHKFKVALESIPEKYFDAYTNVQQEQVLIYNAFNEKNPEQMLPPPQEIIRAPTPPIVQETFLGTDQVTQTILGAYDAEMGITGGDISGKAIQQGALSSNAASLPYLENFIKGMNRIGQIIIDLIPKYYVTPRTVPIIHPNGKRDFQLINQQDNEQSVPLQFDSSVMQIQIEAGVNSAIEKQMALDQIIRMMDASPLFAQFMNQEGLEPLLDNMDIRGIEQLKAKAEPFMQQLKQQQAAAAEKGDPVQKLAEGQIQAEILAIKQREEASERDAQLKAQQLQQAAATEAAKQANEKEKIDLEFIKTMAELELADRQEIIEQERIAMENSRTAVEQLISIADMANKNKQSELKSKPNKKIEKKTTKKSPKKTTK